MLLQKQKYKKSKFYIRYLCENQCPTEAEVLKGLGLETGVQKRVPHSLMESWPVVLYWVEEDDLRVGLNAAGVVEYSMVLSSISGLRTTSTRLNVTKGELDNVSLEGKGNLLWVIKTF